MFKVEIHVEHFINARRILLKKKKNLKYSVFAVGMYNALLWLNLVGLAFTSFTCLKKSLYNLELHVSHVNCFVMVQLII